MCLLDDPRIDPSKSNVFSIACAEGNATLVEILLRDQRVKPKIEDLENACYYGHARNLKILLRDGRLDPRENEGKSFKLAQEKKNPQILEILEKYREETK